MNPDRPLADLAIGASIAVLVLIVTPGLAIAGVVSLVVLAVIGATAVRRRRRGRDVSRRASASARRRADADRARRRAR